MFSGFLKMAGLVPQVQIDNNAVQARLHQGSGGTHLWVTNPTRSEHKVNVSLSPGLGRFTAGEDRWGNQAIRIQGSQIAVTIPARDAVVISLT